MGRGTGISARACLRHRQSGDGYLWIGTQSGLVRFDGLNFRIIRDVPGLQNGESVLGLTADRDGSLWIRLEAMLLRYHNGVFDQPPAQFPVADYGIDTIQSGCVAPLGHRRAGVGLSERQIREGGQFPQFSPISGPGDRSGQRRKRLVGHARRGTVPPGCEHATPVSDGVPDSKINCLLAGDHGDLWVGTDTGMVRWSSSRMAAAGPTSLHQFQVLAMERDRDGNIWAGPTPAAWSNT